MLKNPSKKYRAFPPVALPDRTSTRADVPLVLPSVDSRALTYSVWLP